MGNGREAFVTGEELALIACGQRKTRMNRAEIGNKKKPALLELAINTHAVFFRAENHS